MGIGLMYGGLTSAPATRSSRTTHDFFSTEDSLRLLGSAPARAVQRVTLYDDPAAATRRPDDRAAASAAITPRTKVVALTWVHSSTGVRVPGRARSARRSTDSAGCPADQYVVCVDGVHGFAAVDVDLPDLGCDFLAAGTHKWLFGPRGTGILWGRDWGPLTELIPTFSRPGEPRRPAHPRRLPRLRAPLGARGRVRVHEQRSAATGWSHAPSSRPPSSRRAWPASPGSPS